MNNLLASFNRQRIQLLCWQMRVKERHMRDVWTRWPTMWSKLYSTKRQTDKSSSTIHRFFESPFWITTSKTWVVVLMIHFCVYIYAGSARGVHQAEDACVWPGETEQSVVWALPTEATQPVKLSRPGIKQRHNLPWDMAADSYGIGGSTSTPMSAEYLKWISQLLYLLLHVVVMYRFP